MLLTPAQIKELKKPELLKYALSVTNIQTKLDEIVGKRLEEFTKNLAERFEATEREFEEKLQDLQKKSRERFEKIFAQANPRDLRGLLPKKPPVAWAELPVEIQREIQVMHDNAEGEGITERTLKKRVRQYLVDQFIIEE